MIFKAFKEKSNLKHINKLLNSRTAAIHKRKIESVGVVLNVDEYVDFESFRVFFKEVGILSPKTKIIAYVADINATQTLWDIKFNQRDFGWNGKIKNIELQSFLDTEFDALISFYKQNILQLNLITALSKANFKIGISNTDPRLYDLILDVEPKNFQLFKTELKKYLIVLNKL